jgi:hypothetical protein
VRVALLIALIACSGTQQSPPATIGNRAAPSPDTEPTGTPMIRGQVTDLNGAPLPGATVVMSIDDAPVPTSITDENGRYEREVPPGKYDVLFYYADITLRRRGIVVRGVTTVDQQIDERVTGIVLECTSALASTCHSH